MNRPSIGLRCYRGLVGFSLAFAWVIAVILLCHGVVNSVFGDPFQIALQYQVEFTHALGVICMIVTPFLSSPLSLMISNVPENQIPWQMTRYSAMGTLLSLILSLSMAISLTLPLNSYLRVNRPELTQSLSAVLAISIIASVIGSLVAAIYLDRKWRRTIGREPIISSNDP